MNLSDIIAGYITEMIGTSGNSTAEITRNELAVNLGCVPSQINYVITTRFTPEQGYVVESRRGGGGYIRITRILQDRTGAIMHIVNAIGDQLSGEDARILIGNLENGDIISEGDAKLLNAALGDKPYEVLPATSRNAVRSRIAKNMLMCLVLNNK